MKFKNTDLTGIAIVALVVLFLLIQKDDFKVHNNGEAVILLKENYEVNNNYEVSNISGGWKFELLEIEGNCSLGCAEKHTYFEVYKNGSVIKTEKTINVTKIENEGDALNFIVFKHPEVKDMNSTIINVIEEWNFVFINNSDCKNNSYIYGCFESDLYFSVYENGSINTIKQEEYYAINSSEILPNDSLNTVLRFKYERGIGIYFENVNKTEDKWSFPYVECKEKVGNINYGVFEVLLNGSIIKKEENESYCNRKIVEGTIAYCLRDAKRTKNLYNYPLNPWLFAVDVSSCEKNNDETIVKGLFRYEKDNTVDYKTFELILSEADSPKFLTSNASMEIYDCQPKEVKDFSFSSFCDDINRMPKDLKKIEDIANYTLKRGYGNFQDYEVVDVFSPFMSSVNYTFVRFMPVNEINIMIQSGDSARVVVVIGNKSCILDKDEYSKLIQKYGCRIKHYFGALDAFVTYIRLYGRGKERIFNYRYYSSMGIILNHRREMVLKEMKNCVKTYGKCWGVPITMEDWNSLTNGNIKFPIESSGKYKFDVWTSSTSYLSLCNYKTEITKNGEVNIVKVNCYPPLRNSLLFARVGGSY